jgi:hypothetical protein
MIVAGNICQVKINNMKPKLKIGQRWLLGNYSGQERYLIAEVVSIIDDSYAKVKVIQNIYLNSLWQINYILHEHLTRESYWIYLEGQDKSSQ